MRVDTMIRSGLLQFLVYIGIILFGVGVSWAAYGARISELEKSDNVYVKDHDILIALNTKIDILIRNTCEMQKDLKEHLQKDK